MNCDQIDAYLADLLLELRKRGGADLRFVEEARGHLTDAVEQGIERGLDATAAQHEAIAQFGRAPSVARTFVSDKYRWFDLMVLVAAVIAGFAIAYVDGSADWDDTWVTAFSLVMAAAMCAFIAPRQPWKWALAVGLWLPFLAIVRTGSAESLAMLLLLAFPFAGAYGATALRRTLVIQRGTFTSSDDNAGVFHDRKALHFLAITRHGQIDPELAAITDDPETRLIPFLERIAPAVLRPLGKPESLTDQSEQANARVKKYRVVFGSDKTIVCTIEIRRGGGRVSTHWSRRDA